MLGWQIRIYRRANGGASPATAQSPQGVRLATWQAESLDWLDELVTAGKAIDLGGEGYPCRYTTTAEHVIPRIDDTSTGARNKVVDDAEVTRCRLDEWLLVEAWDQS
jgi:hypothetical protein